MPLLGTAAAAPPGAHGFDTNTPLTSTKARQLKEAGFAFGLRYISRGPVNPHGDLCEAETEAILSAGLALMPVQHVAMPGWIPSAALGVSNGKSAAINAAAAGLPRGINVWLDLEGVAATAKAAEVIGYCNAWFKEVEAAGYASGVYVGANSGLSGEDLFFRLTTRHYWQSGSRVPDIPHRGYQMVQHIAEGDEVAGIAIDRNLTKTDNLGGSVLWVARA